MAQRARTFEQVVDSWLMPSMLHLGNAWRGGSVTVAGEHFVTGAVHRRLALTFQSLPPAPSGGEFRFER